MLDYDIVLALPYSSLNLLLKLKNPFGSTITVLTSMQEGIKMLYSASNLYYTSRALKLVHNVSKTSYIAVRNLATIASYLAIDVA